MKSKKCPRCNTQYLKEPEVTNALSRRDNKTYICSDCGLREGMFDYHLEQMKNEECKWMKEKVIK
jgi:transposase-like protein